MSTPLIDWLIGEAVERAGRVGAGRRASRGAINGAPAACSCRDAACGRRGRRDGSGAHGEGGPAVVPSIALFMSSAARAARWRHRAR